MGRRLIEEEFMASSPLSSGANAPVLPAHWRDFVALTKPRVMTLVVFTGLCGLLAAPGHIHPVLGFTAILCIALGAGAAAALNQWWEADIDAKMKRTASRPLPAGRMERQTALHFGVGLSFFSVILMGMATNWLAAAVLTVSILFYVFIYTIWLKPRTAQNIVIGGAAGAFPPVIGWAAVTGDAPWQAWLLFLIIFMWTPPHTWALTLYSAGDYAKAGIPMMPVARGAKSTRLQIMLYSLAFVPVAIAPAFTGLGGPIYLVVSVAGGLGFLALAFRLWRSRAGDQPDKAEAVGREAALYDVRAEAKPARNLFAFSILYLMALFSALLVEHLSGVGV